MRPPRIYLFRVAFICQSSPNFGDTSIPDDPRIKGYSPDWIPGILMLRTVRAKIIFSAGLSWSPSAWNVGHRVCRVSGALTLAAGRRRFNGSTPSPVLVLSPEISPPSAQPNRSESLLPYQPNSVGTTRRNAPYRSLRSARLLGGAEPKRRACLNCGARAKPRAKFPKAGRYFRSRTNERKSPAALGKRNLDAKPQCGGSHLAP